ncbi:probable E3 ubiquitin-protein ligase XBOS36 isoform X1 [Zingiber officinale]|uniref:probable E3 ubiquitin-protein ligase XBOS36 isoform X1 n=1 Tax=Zingiber officinale TaxID=94328 RepID=UPI001C4B74E6|nr:probable E3 ubiquitin-protein ligase XBOS36 isoform X1 [Zingiber officinale]XP_042405713.1 probable E3 ubiquitin-protein ligase XBOS36 isoform X1 [Zingiber officinale]
MKPGLARSSGFSSPLHIAAAGGHSEIVLLLLEHGAGVNSRSFYGRTPLMEACRSGCWEAVQALLVFDCDVSKGSYWNGRTALHSAAEGGHVACIRLLVAGFLSAGGDEAKLDGFVNQAASSGVTALHLAALSGNAGCVRLLLDLHAAVSAEALCLSSPVVASIGAGSTLCIMQHPPETSRVVRLASSHFITASISSMTPGSRASSRCWI